jgi:redox-sensitive bicupin YhaK (pirin superfamily)
MVFGSGDGVLACAGESGARFLFASAAPLAEPVMQFRSFVMNTADDIGETLEMIREDRLGAN